jgi:AraC-like DNA-binding protein
MTSVSCGRSAALKQNAPLLGESALKRQARDSVYRYAVVAPSASKPIFEGLVDSFQLNEGMRLHRVDARDLQGVAIHADLQPGLRIALTVGGRSDVSYDSHRLLLTPRQGGGADGAIIALAKTTKFIRQSRRGDIERSVCLTLTDEWLEKRLDEALLPCLAFSREHLSVHSWRASSHAVLLAEQILTPPELEGGLLAMYQESRCLALVVEALSSLSGTIMTSMSEGLRQRERARMMQIRELLDSGQADEMTLVDIARTACVSVNTLQRHFRATWGKTVFAYLRDTRLERARSALERGVVSVAQAAVIAGYSSSANFATAFRQQYGIAPGQLGKKV